MHDIAVLADTHVPSRADQLPAWVESALSEADHVIHAGDFDSVSAFEHVENLAGSLTAVTGNMDPSLGLPETTTVAREGVTFLLTHGTGPLQSYRQRLREVVDAHPNTDVIIAGHSHEVLDEDLDGVRLLNPGSATGADPADRATMYRVTVDTGAIDVQLRSGSDH